MSLLLGRTRSVKRVVGDKLRDIRTVVVISQLLAMIPTRWRRKSGFRMSPVASLDEHPHLIVQSLDVPFVSSPSIDPFQEKIQILVFSLEPEAGSKPKGIKKFSPLARCVSDWQTMDFKKKWGGTVKVRRSFLFSILKNLFFQPQKIKADGWMVVHFVSC